MHAEMSGIQCSGQNQDEKQKGSRTRIWRRAHVLKVERDRLTQKAAEPGGHSPQSQSLKKVEGPGEVISTISACAELKLHRVGREERLLSMITYGGGQRTDCRGLWSEGMEKAERL